MYSNLRDGARATMASNGQHLFLASNLLQHVNTALRLLYSISLTSSHPLTADCPSKVTA